MLRMKRAYSCEAVAEIFLLSDDVIVPILAPNTGFEYAKLKLSIYAPVCRRSNRPEDSLKTE